MNNILFFWIQNRYNNIINLYKRKNFPILIKFINKKEIDFFSFMLSKWILCINRNNNYSCNICKSCLLINNNNHPDYYYLYLNNSTINDLLLNINYKSIYINKIIYIYNISILNNEILNLIIKVINKNSNIFFIFGYDNYNNIRSALKNECILFDNNYLDNKFLLNYINNKYNFSKLEKKIIFKLSEFSLLSSIDFINNKLLYKRNIFFEKIELFILYKKNFDIFLFFINDKNKNYILCNIFIIFILDIIKYKLNINNVFNKDKNTLIYKISNIFKINELFKIFKNFIIYVYYSNKYKFINSDFLLIYNVLYISKIINENKYIIQNE